MSEHYPMHFTLASGTKVVVDKVENNAYDFLLTPHDGPKERFTYIDDGRPKTDWDESLEFEQLDALRTFWLKTEEVV
jgi:hypothetical protein